MVSMHQAATRPKTTAAAASRTGRVPQPGDWCEEQDRAVSGRRLCHAVQESSATADTVGAVDRVGSQDQPPYCVDL